MKGSTHLVIALSAGMALSSAFEVAAGDIPWFALLLGALAPDLDEEDSTIVKPSKYLGPLLPKMICDILDSLGVAIARLNKFLFGHRGFLHWPILGVLIMSLGWRYDIYWLTWFGFGYLTHIIADACTVRGVPLYAPIRQDCVSWSKIKTGSAAEWTLVLCCAVYITYWGWSKLPAESQEVIKEKVLEQVTNADFEAGG